MSAVLEAEAAAKFPKKFATHFDSLAWAKRFVYRAERGDKSLLPVQVEFARMALDQTYKKVETK